VIATIPCPCPGTPHESDTVTLRDALAPRDAMAISKDLVVLYAEDPDSTAGDVLAVLTEGYVLRGIEAWTLVGMDGKPLEVTKGAIRDVILSRLDVFSLVGEVADDLYAEAVMLPLLQRASKSSPPTPTEDSTSAPTDSGSKPPTPSRPFSTTTTPMDDIGQTFASPGGDSSFSPSSASAA